MLLSQGGEFTKERNQARRNKGSIHNVEEINIDFCMQQKIGILPCCGHMFQQLTHCPKPPHMLYLIYNAAPVEVVALDLETVNQDTLKKKKK